MPDPRTPPQKSPAAGADTAVSHDDDAPGVIGDIQLVRHHRDGNSLIIKALKKHKGKRKDAASDLGISERTLYRKLKEYDISE